MESKFVNLLSIFLVVNFACTKNKLGGNSKVSGQVLHHSAFIANARVFVKLNATNSAGTDTSKYDARIVCDAAGQYSFKCFKGNYYLYGLGYDTQIKQAVKGGLPITVRTNENLQTDVFVTE
jgi:hypothetical protein